MRLIAEMRSNLKKSCRFDWLGDKDSGHLRTMKGRKSSVITCLINKKTMA